MTKVEIELITVCKADVIRDTTNVILNWAKLSLPVLNDRQKRRTTGKKKSALTKKVKY